MSILDQIENQAPKPRHGGPRPGSGRPRKTAAELQTSGAKAGRVAARLAEERGSVPAVLEPPPPPAKPTLDISAVAISYAQDVLAEKIVTGILLRKAAQRFLADLNRSDISFDPAAAQHIGDYANTLHLELLPWECFLLANLFGFKRHD